MEVYVLGKVFLSDDFVRKAKCKDGVGQEIFTDFAIDGDGKVKNGSVTGLGLRVTSLNAKAFVHSYRFNGKKKRVVVGMPDSMNVASARMIVQKRNAEIDSGIEPTTPDAGKFRRKHGETLGEVIDLYFAQHLSRTSSKHRAEFASLVAPWLREGPKNPGRGGKPKARVTIGQNLKDKLASEITPRIIGSYIGRISSDSVANSTLRHLKSLYN